MTNTGSLEGFMKNNTLDFSGKVALVTGAASGMGLATARAFAEAGAAVVLADFREEVVKAEAGKLRAAGNKVLALRCDVSDDRDVEQMVERTVSEFGQLDAAFNNAGVTYGAYNTLAEGPHMFEDDGVLVGGASNGGHHHEMA